MRALALAALLWPCGRAAAAPPARGRVLAGVDVLETRGFGDLKGKRVGLITNQTGRDRHGLPTVEVLANAPGVTLAALFSPEHGFGGVSEASSVASGSYHLPDGRTVPLFSLYGDTRAPTADMLSGLDALVFDIQGAGARFNTYSTTMAMAMEAAASANIEFVVLDRPDPVGGDIVEGPVLEDGLRSFVAYLPVPIRHGMTMGELARLYNVTAQLGLKLTVVPLRGWRRSMWYDQTGLPWTPPSPDMPDLATATLYPGLALFEPFDVSVGRGTPFPFQWVGAPWLDAKAVVRRLRRARLPGVRFSVQDAVPAKDKFRGRRCRGVRVTVTDRLAARPVTVFAYLAAAVRDVGRKDVTYDARDLQLMAGTREFVPLFQAGAAPARLAKALTRGLSDFKTRRSVFLLY